MRTQEQEARLFTINRYWNDIEERNPELIDKILRTTWLDNIKPRYFFNGKPVGSLIPIYTYNGQFVVLADVTDVPDNIVIERCGETVIVSLTDALDIEDFEFKESYDDSYTSYTDIEEIDARWTPNMENEQCTVDAICRLSYFEECDN